MSSSRLLPFFASLLCVLTSGGGARAQVPAGQIARFYPFGAARVLADPVRSRVYAVTSENGGVAVIDTNTLDVITTVAVGSNPVDLTISEDNNTLYTANRDSPQAAISVLDLNTLQQGPPIPLPAGAVSIAAGIGKRLYVSAGDNPTTLYQVNTLTGTIQATVAAGESDNQMLRTTPDRTILLAVSAGRAYSLASYDVSMVQARFLAYNTTGGTNIKQLAVSHDGRFFCLPSDGNKTNLPNGSRIALYSPAAPDTYASVITCPNVPGPVAFNPDDSLLYVIRPLGDEYLGEKTVQAFSTEDDTKRLEMAVPNVPEKAFDRVATDLTADRTGSYLFMGLAASNPANLSGPSLVAVTTGTGSLQPATLLPVITSRDAFSVQIGQPVSYQIVATNSPTSYAATGLPSGLTIDEHTGLISGIPDSTNFDHNVAAVVSASNASGIYPQSVTIATADAVPLPEFSFLTTQLSVGTPFNIQLNVSNATLVGHLTVTGLPPGLDFEPSSSVVSGTPTQSGTFIVHVSGSNSSGTGAADWTIIVSPQTAPIITSTLTVEKRLGNQSFFTYMITATQNPLAFNATGLPPGLYLQATGDIFGQPTTPGTYPVTISATNPVSTTTATLTIHILPALPILTLNTLESTTAPGSPAGVFVVSLTGDHPADLAVKYILKGSAVNGLDYRTLTGTRKLKAGRSSAKIRVIAQRGQAVTQTVKLFLQYSDDYVVGNVSSGKVKILPTVPP